MVDPKPPGGPAKTELNLPGWLLIVEFAVLSALAAWAAKRYLGLPWLWSLVPGVATFAALMALLYTSRWFSVIYLAAVSLLPGLIAADFLKFHMDAEWAWSVGAVLALLSLWLHWRARSEIDREDTSV